jgi:ribA/ribD-fused uncharacterized protein
MDWLSELLGAHPLQADGLPRPADFDRFHPFMRDVFSQWRPTPFTLDRTDFVCAEQWMMYAKARLFDDEAVAAAILVARDPGEQKRLGQQVAGFEQARWDHWKVAIVHLGTLEKFRQNTGARRQLITTRGAMLVEANPRDWVWGCGLAEGDPALQDPGAWRGENLLGRILTLVREQIDG